MSGCTDPASASSNDSNAACQERRLSMTPWPTNGQKIALYSQDPTDRSMIQYPALTCMTW